MALIDPRVEMGGRERADSHEGGEVVMSPVLEKLEPGEEDW